MTNLEDCGSGIGDKPLVIAADFVWEESWKSRKIWKNFSNELAGGGGRLHKVVCQAVSSAVEMQTRRI